MLLLLEILKTTNKLLLMKNLTSKILALSFGIVSLAIISPTQTQAQAAKGLSPQEQVKEFYAICKEGRAADALKKALSVSGSVKPEDSAKVAEAFSNMVKGMGNFLDYEITQEFNLTQRTVIIRCTAHYKQQPFVNEFTYYNPGNNDWRMVHLRYDANLATMFAREIETKTE